MSRQTVSMDWQVLLDDNEWGRAESLQELVDATQDTMDLPRSARPFPLWLRITAASIALVLLVAGLSLWHFGNLGASRIDHEIHALIDAEAWSQTTANRVAAISLVDRKADTSWQRGVVKELARSETRNTQTVSTPYIQVQKIALRPSMAMAEVTITEPDGLSYREARFYWADPNDGWLRTAPDVSFWGPQQSIETDHFRLSFYRKDAPTVLHVAPKLDAIYEQLYQDAGLSSDGQKLTVVISPVSVYQLPGLYFFGDRLVVHSPYLLQVSVDVSDEAILMKSVVNPLVLHLQGEESLLKTARQQWWPVTHGLQLWEAYVGSDSLSAWYRDVVTWYYRDLRTTAQDGDPSNGDAWALLCREYRIWRYALPNSLVSPSYCNDADGRWLPLSVMPAPERLNDLIDMDDWGLGMQSTGAKESADSIAAATLIDYVVSTYGREKLPSLVASFQTHDNWTTLSPAVFGVSAEELELGWQGYLAEQLGSDVMDDETISLDSEISGTPDEK